ALIPNMTRQNAPDVTKKVLEELEKLNVTVLLSESFINDFEKADYVKYCDIESCINECDIVLTVGGDGTFIKSAKLSSENNKPLLCINAGKLAYLAGLESSELSLLKDVVKGEYKTEKRMMLDATIIDKNGKVIYHSNCLNDAVVSRCGTVRIMNLSIDCNGAHLMDYSADGVIVSTPTGSTAYSFSAGGPVIEPQIDSMLITPICCHSFFSRSVVLRPDSILQIKHDNSGEAMLFCDGEEPVLVPTDAIVKIEISEKKAEFIKVKNDTFIDILNKKMTK
ncbi:MAG: NAD(+)/NADH kinase, partial [Clostridia bacterium]|nr:NAD(+)/NADH kinase [Clostridia bacterium]